MRPFLHLVPALLLLATVRTAAAQTPPQSPDSIEQFLLRLEEAAGSGDRAQVLALSHAEAGEDGAADFAYSIVPRPSRIVIKARDRSTLENGIRRLLLEVFVERGQEGRLSTWRLDLREVSRGGSPESAPPTPDWRIARLDRLTVVSGLYRLSLNPAKQYAVKDLTLVAPDLAIRMASGSAFVAESPEGATAVVLVGRGQMRLAPKDEAEQTQLRIFAGENPLDAEFDGAFVRLRPSEFQSRFGESALTPRAVSEDEFRRATEIFDEFIGRTLHIDLADLSRDRWSLLPSSGDLIAEIRTRRHGSLTYARTWNDAEDISFFDRRRRRNIAVYASAEKLAARGRFYSEDDLVDYDILSYDIEAAFSPDREWVSGNAGLRLKIRAHQLSTMTLRLAESVAVRGVYSPELGRLLHLRVVGQHSLIVNLPVLAPRDSEITLNVIYTGRVEPQELEREAVAVRQEQEMIRIPFERRWIYSNRSYWYPQGSVTDFATLRLRILVPPDFDVVASGMPTAPPAPAPGPVPEGERPRKMYVFESDRPVRYVACVISRFATVSTAHLNIARGGQLMTQPDSEAVVSKGMSVTVQANPRQTGRARVLADKSAEILQFYAELVGDAPYPSFTLAVTESDLPGGHSPPYFAILNQPLPTSTLTWRNDPVAFDNYPAFFLAHELAHQWWGQAVGWKNYHEQWISEGISQYFAALFAERERGTDVMLGVLRQMRRTAMDASDQGPIYLGYRLGHIKADSRVFRALVYNKAAMVLHMLRRMVGDEAFFDGIRRFYSDWQFRKAGTDDFRKALEATSHHQLEAFFEGWIYGASIPKVEFSYERRGDAVVVRFEHRGQVVPLPLTVSLAYVTGETQEIVIPVNERVVERSIPISGPLRRVEVNADHAALAEIEK